MLDIKFIRQHLDLVKDAATKKKITIDLDRLIVVDDARIALMQKINEGRAQQNKASNLIATANDQTVRTEKIEAMRVVKESLQVLEEHLKPITEEWQRLMYAVPNIPDITVPEGKDEEENVTVKEWGIKPVFDFQPKDHIDIMKSLDMVDFERGTKVHGFRGYFLKNMGAQLSWAIWNYARDFFGAREFMHMITPAMVHRDFFYGTGHLPNDAEDLYAMQDNDHLAGTAEVPMMAYHSDEILSQAELPLKYLAFSPCFRREAGSHSRDVKGLIRVHEFYKLEQLVICEGTHQESDRWFEEVNKNHEEFIESLGIPYRRILICTGDLSASKVKQYDTELWVPMENTYREISSASYFHDYQTRRFNIRYRDNEGKVHFTHSLNCTAIPTPRILVSLIENFQQADGSVKIPPVLQKYLGGVEKIG